jgi:hypothetical protein
LSRAKAFFSIFRRTGRHEIAGIWLEDLLDGDRRLWLMGEGMELSTPTEGAFGMRFLDAGEFHIGFGIVVFADAETTQFSIQGMTQNGLAPIRYSLASTPYGDSLYGTPQLSSELD